MARETREVFAVVSTFEGKVEQLLGVFFYEGNARDFVLECEANDSELGVEFVCVAKRGGSVVDLEGIKL